ncbi:MAG TPA: ABC transporter permease [Phototrophicaceae bacterium]|nr:ABC transporter permease [Phototrophicaceae bacterium]
MPLYRYMLRRVLFVIPLLLGITLVAFIIANAVPADPINANLPSNQLNNPQAVEAFREKWGLNKSPVEQYLIYLNNLLHGDFGTSIKTHNPVAQDIAQFLPATIELATVGTVFGIVIGVLIGLVSAVWRNRPIDFVVRTIVLIGVSVPVFVLALIGLSVLHGQWNIVPGIGRLNVRLSPPPNVTGLFTVDALIAGQWNTFRDAFSHLILPSLVLGLYIAGLISRVTRSSMLDVLGADYMRTARAKGLRERIVVLRHGLSNALLPIVTVIGLSYGSLLSGAVLTESIFAWPGIGRYMFRASTSQDFPAIMGVSILIAFIYVVVNLIVDILYYFIDPRIRAA